MYVLRTLALRGIHIPLKMKKEKKRKKRYSMPGPELATSRFGSSHTPNYTIAPREGGG